MDDKITIDCQTLRPCPFCGEAPEVSDRASNDTATGHVWFIVCMCGGYSAHAHQHGDTQESATTAWNRRAALAAQPAPAAVPPGYALVPIDPTERMGNCGFRAGAKSSFAADMIYRAMIAAAGDKP
jgi:Lar family restriction alleviation protein